jgi:signal transduction histidine kinase
VQDKLDIIFWVRPAQAPEMIFGCLVEAGSLRDLWPRAFPEEEGSSSRDLLSKVSSPEFVLALLDDKARPVATKPAGAVARDWKRPFVASEIGEALPHWEAALYLMRPQQLQESARTVRRTLLFLVIAAVAAIACGGWIVVADARRQLALAQKKTDFVSNVSHELKTPLTSIRMFAELMQNGRPETAEKFPQYLRIIMVEAERLTRLINNVLDFAKIERQQKDLDWHPLDLHDVIARTWEGQELHLQESGFTTRWEAAEPPYSVVGDEDALAQILVNLLSNAEKYSSNGRKEIELHTYLDGSRVCVSVLDRGSGVPANEERKIFEPFYRAHDSLSSGIQGSGLGLTLARRLASEHGGEIVFQPREGGGSNFTLRLPLAKNSTS